MSHQNAQESGDYMNLEGFAVKASYTWMSPLMMFVIFAVVFSIYPADVAEADPGLGVAFFDNARPNCPAPEGFDASDWEWRPLYLSNSGSYEVQQNPNLLDKPYHGQSRVAWKDNTGTYAWPDGSKFVHGGVPSGLWRRYSETLYHQVNNAVIPDPDSVPGYQAGDYYYDRYGAGGTIPANQLPDNWYMEPMKCWLVSSALTSCGNMSNWGMYQDISELYYFEDANKTIGCGAKMGAGGASMYAALIVAEYALTIAYDQQVEALNEELEAYRAAQMPAEHDYYGIDDPSLGKRIVVRRKVPNFSVPSGCDSSIPPARDSQGSVGITTPAFEAPQQFTSTDFKSVTFNESFTTASVPFQFSIEPSHEGGPHASEFSGRFILRLHDSQGAWHEFPIAGVKDGHWISPWDAMYDRDAQSAWNSTDNDADAVSTDFATSATDKLSIAWSGQVIVRAHDLGVSHFDQMQIKTIVSARGAAPAPVGPGTTAETTTVRSWLAVQPAFTRNIAEAGPWASKEPGQSVTLTADTSLIPSNASFTTYTWTLPDGPTQMGTSASYTFDTAGIYDVQVMVDPTVPEQAPNAYLFNDPEGGLSYDICRVAVGQSAPDQGDQDDQDDVDDQPPQVTVDNVQAHPDGFTIDWTTDEETTAVVHYRNPDGQESQVGVDELTGDHSTTINGLQEGTQYTLWITATDEQGNSATSAESNHTTAGGAPNIQITNATSTNHDRFTVEWNTDEPADSTLVYHKTGDPETEAHFDEFVTDHSMTVTGLTGDTAYEFWVKSADPGGNEGGTDPLTVTTLPGGTGSVTVAVICVEPQNILEGAAVCLDSWQNTDYAGETDENGQITFDNVSVGDHTILANEDGYTQGTKTVTVQDGETDYEILQLVFAQRGSVTVNVTNADDNQPLAGAGVCVDSWQNTDYVGDTDGNGTITFDDISVGDHTITAAEDDYHQANATVTVEDEQTASVDLQLEPERGSVTVWVKSADNHQPLAGAGVCVDSWQNTNVVLNTDYFGQTDANGMITFDDVSVGDHTIIAAEEGYDQANETVTVEHEQITDVHLYLATTIGSVKVHVTRADNNQPIQGAGVCVDTWAVSDFVGETDANGDITFDEVSAGDHTVIASEPGYRNRNADLTIQTGQTANVSLQLPLDTAVYGSIKVPVNLSQHARYPTAPADGGDGFLYINEAQVTASPGNVTVESCSSDVAMTYDANMVIHGFYEFENLPAGLHTIQVDLQDYGWTSQPFTVNINQPGQEVRHDFVLQLAGDQHDQDDDQDQGGGDQGPGVEVKASHYSPHFCSEIVGWDWLRKRGARVVFIFDGSDFEACDPSRVKLRVNALCTNRSSGGAGYSTDLTFELSATSGRGQEPCKVKMKNPFDRRDPNLTTGKGYRFNGESGYLPADLIERAIQNGHLTALIQWPDGLSEGTDRHVAFRKDSLTFVSQ